MDPLSTRETDRQSQSTAACSPLYTPKNEPVTHHKSVSSSPEPKHNLLTKIKRKSDVLPMKDTITPDLAAQVVRQYLLPMFEADNRAILQSRRATTYSSPRSSASIKLTESPNTVYTELKLSDRLAQKVQDMEEEMKCLQKKYEDARQAEASMSLELKSLKDENTSLQGSLQLIKSSGSHYIREEMQTNFLTEKMQIEVLQQRIEDAEQEKERIGTKLYDQKQYNDKYKNNNTELVHENGLLKMENDIMGEQLKGIYQTLSTINSKKFVEEKLTMEFKTISKGWEIMTEENTNLLKSIQKINSEKDQLQEQLREALKLYQEMKAERDKTVITTKERVIQLMQERDLAQSSYYHLYEEHSQLDHKHKILAADVDKFRQKVKLFKSRRKINGYDEEKQCKICGKAYFEDENFNWSCRTHPSDWGGEMYWCCGKTFKEAPGCQVNKHECKDEEEDEDALEEKQENEKIRILNSKCYSCKDFSHLPNECPKDPNLRSHYDESEEFERVKGIKKIKKNPVNDLEQHQFVMEMMRDHVGETTFAGYKQVSNSNFGSSLQLDSDEEGGFADVLQLKDEVTFDLSNNFHDVSEIFTKEFERETLSTQRAKGKEWERRPSICSKGSYEPVALTADALRIMNLETVASSGSRHENPEEIPMMTQASDYEY